MTNEEIIYWLDDIRDEYIYGRYDLVDIAQRIEAIDLAIKALKKDQN